MKKIMKLFVISAMFALMIGCSDDDNDSPDTGDQANGGNGGETGSNGADTGGNGASEQRSGISMGFKDTGDTEPEYVLTKEDISQGSVNATGAGDEQIGWNFFYRVGKTLFVTGYQNFEAKAYRVNDAGDVEQISTFFYDWPLEAFGSVGDDTLIASDQPRDGTHTTRKLYTVDATTGLITAKTDYSIFDDDTGTPGEGSVGWATALEVRGSELFIPFQKLDDGGNFFTPDADMAYVAIYDYPLAQGASPKAIISDDRTSNIGVNGSSTGLIEAEGGDLYSFSCGSLSAGFSPASTKPSGILRIKGGESEFDAEYFFNIEEATNGGKLFWFDYVGDNKAIGRLITDETNNYAWSAYTKDPESNAFTQKLVIIDLANQTVTDVAGIPLHHKRYTSNVDVMDGKVYVSIETEEVNNVYEVDIATATATQGAVIEGKTIKGFYNLHD